LIVSPITTTISQAGLTSSETGVANTEALAAQGHWRRHLQPTIALQA